VFKHRHVIVMRRENMGDHQRKHLQTMLEYVPALRTLRKFIDTIHRLFEPNQSEHQAWCRWHALQKNPAFQAIAELTKVLALLVGQRHFCSGGVITSTMIISYVNGFSLSMEGRRI
jgi:hypothetical protein